jgi:hypothetical protein
MRQLFFVFLLATALDSKAQAQPETNILFNAFKQGNVNGGGNCASIALIKASIGKFGVGNIFKYSKNKLDGSILVKA